MFPNDDNCGVVEGVAAPVAPNNAQTIIAAINGTGPDGGGTPTRLAIEGGGRYLMSLSTPNPRYIVPAPVSWRTVTMPSHQFGMPVPRSRGPLSALIISALVDRQVQWADVQATAKMVATTGVLQDEDAQLSLLMLYELHYREINGVDDSWEWHPELLAVRGLLEDRFETEIRERTDVPGVPDDGDIPGVLFRMTAPQPGPSLSKFIAQRATVEQFREFLTHRSVYHLKEADPHTWAIPRLARAREGGVGRGASR